MGVKLRAFLDAGVPDPVGLVLNQAGHEVIYHRHVLPEKTADQVVAIAALANKAVLVAFDHDMRYLVQHYGATTRGDRFAQLSLMRFCCDEMLAAKRLEFAMSFVENEWIVAEQKRARRMWIDIGPHFLRSNR